MNALRNRREESRADSHRPTLDARGSPEYTHRIDELKLSVRIALQDYVWEKFGLDIPTQEILYAEFRSEHKQILNPEAPEDIPEFIANFYSKFLEPIPGFVRLCAYSEKELKRAGIELQLIEKDRYVDPLYKMYWSQR